ncbi:MAG: hypothetical protein U1F43_37845 [Myxococcota bacterium]
MSSLAAAKPLVCCEVTAGIVAGRTTTVHHFADESWAVTLSALALGDALLAARLEDGIDQLGPKWRAKLTSWLYEGSHPPRRWPRMVVLPLGRPAARADPHGLAADLRRVPSRRRGHRGGRMSATVQLRPCTAIGLRARLRARKKIIDDVVLMHEHLSVDINGAASLDKVCAAVNAIDPPATICRYGIGTIRALMDVESMLLVSDGAHRWPAAPATTPEQDPIAPMPVELIRPNEVKPSDGSEPHLIHVCPHVIGTVWCDDGASGSGHLSASFIAARLYTQRLILPSAEWRHGAEIGIRLRAARLGLGKHVDALLAVADTMRVAAIEVALEHVLALVAVRVVRDAAGAAHQLAEALDSDADPLTSAWPVKGFDPDEVVWSIVAPVIRFVGSEAP